MRAKKGILFATVIAATMIGCGGKSSATNAVDISGMDFFDKLYGQLEEEELPMYIEQRELDLTDTDTLMYQIGIDHAESLDHVIVSESMVTSSPYSLMYLELKEGADANAVLEEVLQGVDPRRWICVEADVVSGMVFGDDVFVLMTDSELGDVVFEAAQSVGEEIGQSMGDRMDR